MYRPIIILAIPISGVPAIAYLGEDAAVAEKLYQELAADSSLSEVREYYFPNPRRTAAPASVAQVTALSSQMQASGARDRIRAEVLVKARARLTAEKRAEIEEQAIAEAEAAVKASETVGAAIDNVVARAASIPSAEAAVAEEVVKVATEAAEGFSEGGVVPPSAEPVAPAEKVPAEPAEGTNYFTAAAEPAALLAPTPPRRAKRS